MYDLQIRELKEKILTQFISLIPEWVTPNQVTLLSLFFGVMCGVFCSGGQYTIALYFWIFNRIADGIDGTLARVRNKQTDFGGYLDIIVDFIVYSIVPISIAMRRNDLNVYLSLSFMLATFFVNAAGLFYLSALLEKRHYQGMKKELTSVTMPPALIEGVETVIFFSLFMIFFKYISFLYWLFGLGVCITICQRVEFARKVLQ